MKIPLLHVYMITIILTFFKKILCQHFTALNTQFPVGNNSKFKGEGFEVCVLYGGVLNHTLLRIRNTQHINMFSLFSKQIEVCILCIVFFFNLHKYKI